ncbi:hypothetical protein CBC_A1642 [Clostridium botulinum C str. Eklund]|nr:hypothetical protein CBC_A1642 [Clostridium botulinum C str. Eklund]
MNKTFKENIHDELEEKMSNYSGYAKANLHSDMKKQKKQQFQLGDIAYMIDADYNFYESEIYRIDLINDKYIYTCETDFEDNDIGDWVLTSEVARELHLEAMLGSEK